MLIHQQQSPEPMNIAIIINNGDTNDHITIIPFSGGI
jgi:hypothetical protein